MDSQEISLNFEAYSSDDEATFTGLKKSSRIT